MPTRAAFMPATGGPATVAAPKAATLPSRASTRYWAGAAGAPDVPLVCACPPEGDEPAPGTSRTAASVPTVPTTGGEGGEGGEAGDVMSGGGAGGATGVAVAVGDGFDSLTSLTAVTWYL